LQPPLTERHVDPLRRRREPSPALVAGPRPVLLDRPRHRRPRVAVRHDGPESLQPGPEALAHESAPPRGPTLGAGKVHHPSLRPEEAGGPRLSLAGAG